ncbi:MAG: alpha/beta hydrolase [Candidatus Binatia bacterium]|nr:alpha/beta hydrolase [Candidatus Binatia bacterium]
MSELLKTGRPLGMSYWPLPEDAPDVDLVQEEIRLLTPDGMLVRGMLWTPAGKQPKTAVLLAHPRGDFTVHYACPLLAAAGFAVLGFSTRYLNNDADCLHEKCVIDVETAVAEMRRRGAEKVVLFGNSGGGSLMALAQAETGCGDAWVGVAAHPGEGVFMGQVIDPSVADEDDPHSVVPELDMYDPRNGWKPWPEPATYDRGWLENYRAAQRDRIERIDTIARDAIAAADAARRGGRDLPKGSDEWREARRRGLHTPYLTIYRTLANPVYLDPTIDPDDRPLGSLFAFPDPFEANYFGRFGLARVMTPYGWLSTWSSLSSSAKLADTMPKVTCPVLLIHPTADTEIRTWQAREVRDRAGSDDVTYHELEGALHYLEGHRKPAMELVVSWLRERFS